MDASEEVPGNKAISGEDDTDEGGAVAPMEKQGKVHDVLVDFKQGAVQLRRSTLTDVTLHRDVEDGNMPVILRERREAILVATDPRECGCYYERLSPAEIVKRKEELLQRIRDNDEKCFVAKFFHCRLASEGAASLRSALKGNTHLVSLYLTGNQLGEEGCVALCKALARNTTLTKLDIQCNRLGHNGGQVLGELLMVNNTLYELNVAGNELEDDGCEGICKALIFNRKSRLGVLNLGNNRITHGRGTIASLIRSTRSLQTLYCWRNRLGHRPPARRPLWAGSTSARYPSSRPTSN